LEKSREARLSARAKEFINLASAQILIARKQVDHRAAARDGAGTVATSNTWGNFETVFSRLNIDRRTPLPTR